MKEMNQVKFDAFSLHVSNPTHFYISMRKVSSGFSFRYKVNATQATLLVAGAADIIGFIDLFVRQSLRSTGATNQLRIIHFLSSDSLWAFSFTFDTEIDRSDAYMDLRVCIFVQAWSKFSTSCTYPFYFYTGLVMYAIF